jgi:hypothetical protein
MNALLPDQATSLNNLSVRLAGPDVVIFSRTDESVPLCA